jgi:hypothetical protein
MLICKMKTIRFIATLLLPALFFVSCKKDATSTPTVASSSFQCKVDGKDYKVEGTLAYGFNFDTEFGVYGLTGDGNQETCFITIPGGTAKGTYAFDTKFRGNFTDIAKVDYSTLWGSGSGSVTIEAIDAKHVAGTFYFTAYDGNTATVKKAITEGKFNVLFR